MVYTIQLPDQKANGMVAAGKEAKAAELRTLGLKAWPDGMSGQIDKALSFARDVASSGVYGDGPFHVVVTGTVPDAGESPTISVGISGR